MIDDCRLQHLAVQIPLPWMGDGLNRVLHCERHWAGANVMRGLHLHAMAASLRFDARSAASHAARTGVESLLFRVGKTGLKARRAMQHCVTRDLRWGRC